LEPTFGGDRPGVEQDAGVRATAPDRTDIDANIDANIDTNADIEAIAPPIERRRVDVDHAPERSTREACGAYEEVFGDDDRDRDRDRRDRRRVRRYPINAVNESSIRSWS